MRIGTTFLQSDLELDPIATRDYVQAVEGMGFDHLLTYDHVLGASAAHRPGWNEFHDSEDRFHEIFVLFGYLAAVTSTIELVTGILCLPQRQTALVAKQAAEVDLLTGGRLRIGVGIGWNDVEFEALGERFGGRGQRIEEQIELLRNLWTEPVVDFHGKWHDVTYAGLNPLPVQRPIPIWYGSRADSVLDRVARLADGWMPDSREPDIVAPQVEKLRELTGKAGRDPGKMGLQARLSARQGGPDVWVEHYRRYLEMGFTHFCFSTIWSGASTVDEHLKLLQRFRDEVGVPQ
ncbi:LLM class F420-dependent oxidoreductase [Amycolatopsis pithecellobii]|uniref:TIGR03619 family F420-dependent LLM class oxidoreductase n=1 Tax=Amycolatopsis pithecellobii TaxID=664692 RepID=A0A6N7YWX0_9PSEU|nr:LLM class F420-dependent oxidoreductase [Amycolatopsis pithecellobii]MTD57587.1 TIGR03619 family F420-dependent LLM class oxidoreductase [Amycolatopsis pithecellobii]